MYKFITYLSNLDLDYVNNTYITLQKTSSSDYKDT